MQSLFDSIVQFLNAGIAGKQVTPLRLLVVLILMSALVWATRKGTRLLVAECSHGEVWT
jgi:hypothetical protein